MLPTLLIGLWDFLLLPIFLLLIYRIAFNFRDKHYPPGHPWRKPFINGLHMKIGGAIAIALLYNYYYGTGDTMLYFYQGTVLNSSFAESPSRWLNLILHTVNWYDPGYTIYTSRMWWYAEPATSSILTISALLSALTFNTFLPTSVLFAALAYTGIWAMYRTFASQYPALTKPLAIAILYIPSTFIWGSGIFKDTVCMFALGWLTYGVFQGLVKRQFSFKVILITILSFYLIAVVKIYILVAFLPALIMWVMFMYTQRIGSSGLRFIVKLGIIGILAVSFPVALSLFSESLGNYSIEKVTTTSEVTRSYLEKISGGDEGSGYTLGAIDPTPLGMLKKFPLAVNVALFRPYIWESKKLIQLLNALEASMFLLVTLKIIFLIGPRRAWRAISSDANIQFCLIFSLIFAFAVGISTYNFGSLSRYRIPCLPLYATALVLINYKYRSPDSSLFQLK